MPSLRPVFSTASSMEASSLASPGSSLLPGLTERRVMVVLVLGSILA